MTDHTSAVERLVAAWREAVTFLGPSYEGACIRARADQLAAAIKQDSEAGAVAWHTEDHLADKSATTYSAEVAERWRNKGWPVHPLYARPAAALPEVDDLLRQAHAVLTRFRTQDDDAITVCNRIERALTAALRPETQGGEP